MPGLLTRQIEKPTNPIENRYARNYRIYGCYLLDSWRDYRQGILEHVLCFNLPFLVLVFNCRTDNAEIGADLNQQISKPTPLQSKQT